MRNKTRMLGIAMAMLVIVSMVGVTGVTAKDHTAAVTTSTVTAPITGTPVGVTDLFRGIEWYIVQGASTAPNGYNIYYQEDFNGWVPVGTGTNPTGVATFNAFYILARSNSGALWAKKTTDGSTWSNVGLPATQVLAGTGPTAVWTADNVLEVFYVNTARQLVDVSLDLNTAETTVTNLGGVVFATPAAATDNSFLAKVVVVKGTGGKIYEQTFLAGAWSGWSRAFHDGLIGNGAALMTDLGSANDMYLFVAGTDNRVYALQSTNGGLSWRVPNPVLRPGYLGWDKLGGVTTSGVSAHWDLITADSTAWVDVRGGDGNVWENFVGLDAPTVTLSGGWYLELTGP